MPRKPSKTDPAIRVGISACLLGQRVRYDGGHKHDRYLTETLGQYFQWVPVCPEVELGLGTPREAIQLVQCDDRVRLKTVRTGQDLTARMRRFARRRAAQLARQQLCGFVLKKDSPSCGMQRVKVRQARGAPRRSGRGLFAEALIERMPHLPVEEEGRLADPRLRENWIQRVFAYHALQQLWAGRWRVADLIDFHRRYKFVLLAHSEIHYRQLGQLVAAARSMPRAELRREYERGFMTALQEMATPRRHSNVLQHLAGFFKKELDSASRRELQEHIDQYRRGLVPLIVPLTLVRHFVRVLDVQYLQDQVYLNPHPKELALLNHV